jgi:hypothetical protein
MNPSRRSLFTALASVVPAGDDPIYAAIERHRAAWKDCLLGVRQSPEPRYQKRYLLSASHPFLPAHQGDTYAGAFVNCGMARPINADGCGLPPAGRG